MKLMKKTDLMNRVKIGDAREVFEHSEDGAFDVTAMRKWCMDTGLEPVLVDVAAIAPYILKTRVYEQDRVDALTEAEAMFDPGMGVVFDTPEGEQHLYIDGTHRALRLHQMGFPLQKIWLVKEADIIRPAQNTARTHDWGDEFKDGQIIKRQA